MRIAIVGTGISGNAAAHALSTGSPHEIVVFERDARVGGHSATVDIDYDGSKIAVDTGFIVYNELNYPNLTALFAHLGVATENSDMGFSVSVDGGRREWASREGELLGSLLARRRNAVSPRFWLMVKEVLRFNRQALADRAAGRLAGRSLGDYLAAGRFAPAFIEDYLLPMGAAIWSTPVDGILAFPAESFVTFFENHRLLHWDRPAWRTVTGGSRSYVGKLTAPFRDRIRVGVGAARITRTARGVEITGTDGGHDIFDQVILATHSDEALALLDDASPEERAILGAVGYRGNDVYLHRDTRLMPRRKAAWASWNVLQWSGRREEVTVSYWMNALQNIDRGKPLFVSLNPPFAPDPALTFGRFNYAHPQFDGPALAAQKRLADIQGRRRTWFCGAWTGYGFHEDGLISGLEVAEALGSVLSWRRSSHRFAEAAE
jgi:predicted NAD/FAD-binding protein